MSKNRNSWKNKESTMNLCTNCGALVPYDEDTCLICGTNIHNEMPVLIEEIVSISSLTPAAIHNNRRYLSFISFILAIIMLVFGVAGGVFQSLRFQRTRTQYNTGQSVLYQQKDSLKIQLPSFSAPYVLTNNYITTQDPQIKEMAPITAKSSYDNRFVGYLNNSIPYADGYSGDLYLSDLHAFENKNVESQPGTRLTDDFVVDFLFSPKNHSMVYLTTNGDLYLCDYSKTARTFSNDSISTFKLDTDVGGIGGISGDQLLYYKGAYTTPNTLTTNRKAIREIEYYNAVVPLDLYKMALDTPHTPKLISKDVTDILDNSADYTSLLLTRQTGAPPRGSYVLYHYNEDQNTLSIIESDLAYIIDSDSEKGKLVYLKANEDIVRFESLFTDGMLGSDSDLEDPSLAHRPIFPTPEEEEELLEARDLYDQKKLRDDLRDYLRREIKAYKESHYITYTLYVKTSWSSEAVAVSPHLIGLQPVEKLVSYNHGANSLLYVTADFNTLERKDISSFTEDEIKSLMGSSFDLGAFLSQNLSETLMIYHIGSGGSSKIYAEQGGQMIGDYYIGQNEKQLYFLSYPSYDSQTGTLYSVIVRRENMENIIYADDLVVGVVGYTENGNLVYQTASKDTPPLYSLYQLSPAGVEEIAYDSGKHDMVQIVGESNDKILYLSDYKFATQTGELSEFKEESIKIAEQTHQYLYFGKGKYLLIKQNQFQKRDFYLLENNKLHLLDEDIGSVYSFSEEYNFFPEY